MPRPTLSPQLCAIVAALLAAGPATAAPLLDAMRGNTLTCGMGIAIFVDTSGTKAQMIGYGHDRGTGVPEATLVLDPTSLTRPDRVDIAVPQDGSSTRLSYRTTGDNPLGSNKPSLSNIGSRGIRLLVDGDQEGDDCAVEKGYPAFVETRFNFIREGVCGNDPLDACIDALRRSCGASPDAACVTRSRPMLKRINDAAGKGRR